jgi:histidine triad (HIT) family protein
MSMRMPVMDPCYFCELLNGAAWNLLAGDDLTATLLNGRQYELGQCLVIPRRHAPTLLDLTDAEAAALMRAARSVGRVLVEQFSPDGLLVYQNNGVGSGQEVPHFHLHVVPRRAGAPFAGPPRLAEVERGLRAQRDYAAVTAEKLATVAELRRALERE